MIQKFLSGWSFMRLLRLTLGIAIIVQGAMVKDWLFIALGALFTLMPIFNIGCCGASSCNTNYQNNNAKTVDEISFEEIKSEQK